MMEQNPIIPFQSESNVQVPQDYTTRYENMGAQTQEETAMGALKELSFRESPMGAIAKWMAIREAEQAGGKLVDPASLNERFQLEKPFTEPTTERVATLIAGMQTEKYQLQQKVEQGPDSTAFTFKKFGAQLMYGMMDPINVAAGAFTGWGAGALAAKLGVTGAAGGFAAEVAGNIAGNVATEPLVMGAASKAQENVDVGTALTMDVAMGVALPVFFKGAGYGFKSLKRLGKANPSAAEKVIDAQISRVIDGQSIDISPVERAFQKDIQGTDFMPYTHQEFSLDGRKLYSATAEAQAAFSPDKLEAQPGFVDGVLYLSDDPNVANGMAARNTSQVDGTVFEHNISDAKLFDANEMLAKGKSIEQIKKAATAEGYDGFYFREERPNGQPHNVVGLIDNQKAGDVKSLTPDRVAVPDAINQAEAKQIMLKQLDNSERMLSETTIDTHAEKIREILNTPDEPASPKLLEDRRVTKETIDSLENDVRYTEDPEIKPMVEELKKSFMASEDYQKMVRAAIGCVRS